SLPDDVKKGKKLEIVAYGTVNPDVGVISGGDVDIHVQLDGDSVYSAVRGCAGTRASRSRCTWARWTCAAWPAPPRGRWRFKLISSFQ
ncbi:unnamed protein product, partial [Heterosigma akashiwo]